MKGLIFLNGELEKFLEREDIKASRKRNEAWAKDHQSMDAQAKQQFVADCRAEEAEINRLAQSIGETSIEEIYNRGDEETNRLASIHGEGHPEVIASRQATDKHVDNFLGLVSKLRNHTQNRVTVIENNPDVRQALGDEFAKNMENRDSILEDKQKEFEKQKAARRSIKNTSIDGAGQNQTKMMQSRTDVRQALGDELVKDTGKLASIVADKSTELERQKAVRVSSKKRFVDGAGQNIARLLTAEAEEPRNPSSGVTRNNSTVQSKGQGRG